MAEIKVRNPVIIPGDPDINGLSQKVTLTFRVLSDNRKTDDGFIVQNFDSVPKMGSPYSFGGVTRYSLRARAYKPKFVSVYGKQGAVWDVEVSYDNTHKADEPPEPTEADPFTISRKMERLEVPMEVDLDGQWVRNSAFQKYDTPPMLELLYPVFTIGRTEYINPCRRSDDFENKVNAIPFWGFAPGAVLMKSISPSTSITYGVPSWSVQYEIAINLYSGIDMWQTEVLDAGTMEIDFIGGPDNVIRVKAILDAQGKEVTQAVPLNGEGHPLSEGGAPVWHWYRKRYVADFNLLKIPNPYMA
jgi:hypothetical protein